MTENETLPNGWSWINLGEVAEFLDARRIPINESERERRISNKSRDMLFPYYGANGQVGWIDNFIFDEPLVLLAEDGGYFEELGRVAYRIDGKTWVNNHAHVLRPLNNITLEYLLYALNGTNLLPYVSGTTRLKLTQAAARRIPIPLPPKSEQCRVVSEVTQLMTRLHSAKQALQKVPPTLKRYRQVVLAKAFRGELTTLNLKSGAIGVLSTVGRQEHDRKHGAKQPESVHDFNSTGNARLPVGWEWTTIGEISSIIQYGYTASSSKSAEGPKLLRITDIQDGYVDWDHVPHCEIEASLEPKFALRNGDILFARSGATTGKTYLVRNPPRAVFASYLIRVQLLDSVSPEYLSHFLDSDDYWSQLTTKGIAQPNANSKVLGGILFPRPPLDQQRRIVEVLSKAIGQLKEIQDSVRVSTDTLGKLENSVLVKALKGRLPPKNIHSIPA